MQSEAYIIRNNIVGQGGGLFGKLNLKGWFGGNVKIEMHLIYPCMKLFEL